MHFEDVGGFLSWQTRAGECIPVASERFANCKRSIQKEGGAASQTLGRPVSPLELNTGSEGWGTRCPATQPQEPIVETRSSPWMGVTTPFAGFGRTGACWGTGTSPTVLMLGAPDPGGLGAAELMRRIWPRSQNSRRPLQRRRWLSSWQPGRRREKDNPRCVDTMRRCEPLRILGG